MNRVMDRVQNHFDANSECQLCRSQGPLRQSHVIPHFVFDWLKRTAPAGMRMMESPNQRIQDGIKLRLLCAKCEQLVGRSEKDFCEQAFLPLHAGKGERSIRYGEWALRFAVSISWRSLLFIKSAGWPHLTDAQQRIAMQALERWRSFLIGGASDPARFHQHVVPLGAISGYSGPKPSPFLNRYLMRAIDIDLLRTDTDVLVYTKLCRLLVVGVVSLEPRKPWQPSQLRLREGFLGGDRYELPSYMLHHFNRRADLAAARYSTLTPRQADKVRQTYRQNSDRMRESEIFQATTSDLLLSGDAALTIAEPRHSSQ